jgi:MIP family channel proteins
MRICCPLVDALEYSRRGVAEFIGTFALVFIGATAGLYNDLVATALASGFVIAVFVSAFAGISGGHFNPAVTLGYLVTRRIPALHAVFYWILQFGAAALAALLLKWIFPSNIETSSHLGAPAINSAITSGKAVTIEAICTFFLVLAYFATLVDAKGAFDKIAGLAIGLTVAFAIMMAGPLTGGALNPARAFGPQLVGDYWKNAWVWYVGPLAGGALAAILYELLYLAGRPYHDEEIGAPAELYTPEDVADAIHDPDTVVIDVPEPQLPEAQPPSAGGAEPPPSTPR